MYSSFHKWRATGFRVSEKRYVTSHNLLRRARRPDDNPVTKVKTGINVVFTPVSFHVCTMATLLPTPHVHRSVLLRFHCTLRLARRSGGRRLFSAIKRHLCIAGGCGGRLLNAIKQGRCVHVHLIQLRRRRCRLLNDKAVRRHQLVQQRLILHLCLTCAGCNAQRQTQTGDQRHSTTFDGSQHVTPLPSDVTVALAFQLWEPCV